jgi:erythromycin esterase-like protein
VPPGYDRVMRWTEVPAAAWRTPQELVEEGFRRGRVVMLNEAHDGLTRCVRTRQLGRQLLPSAHALGARHLAMEALTPDDAAAANTSRRPPDAADGYLAQPDMAALIQAALELGWTLWAYEADLDHAPAALGDQGFVSQGFTNWREMEQARNLAAVLTGLPASDRLLVWCGNSHASKAASPDWTPMGHHFAALVAEEAFVIDQAVTVAFPGLEQQQAVLVAEVAPILDRYGGTAGLLREDAGPLACWPGVDALILSTDNAMA